MEDDDPDRIERLWAEVAALRAQLTEFQIHRMQHEIATLRNQLAAPDETETDLLHDPEPIEASANAETFLREMLADHHEVPAETIWTAAHEKGISERTLKRVKSRIGVKTERRGYGPHGRWFWSLRPLELESMSYNAT